MICPEYPYPSFLFFTEQAPPLLYYSHFLSMIISLIIGVFVFSKSRQSLAAKLLLGISITFFIWALLNLIAWTNNDSQMIMFAWSFFGIAFSLLCIFSLYFVYAFIDKKDITMRMKYVLGALFLPVIIFASTKYHINEFDVSVVCGVPEEGVYYTNYYYIVGLVMFLWILVFLISRYRKAIGNHDLRKQIVLLGCSIELFLLSFFTTGYIASLLMENSYNIEFYGLFGMTFFMGVLAYLIVKFKAFEIKLIAAQALIFILVLLIGSQFTFAQSTASIVLTGITLALSIVSGYFLIRSVKSEVQRKEELQIMADRLAIANDELRKLDNAKTEFISIASHQLRTPLTAIKGFVSLLLEGAYGEVNPEAREAINKIHLSGERLIRLVEDLLNVSRIEAGRMIFEKKPGQLEDVVKEICEGLEMLAREKNLYLDWKLPKEKLPSFDFDASKMKEVVSNLVENAIKYSDKGGVTVRVERTQQTTNDKSQDGGNQEIIRFTVSDTGIGIPADEIPNLFKKFSRGKNTKRLNATGTGLGLFVVKNIVENHGGKIWIESKGEGMGTKFVVELPVANAGL